MSNSLKAEYDQSDDIFHFSNSSNASSVSSVSTTRSLSSTSSSNLKNDKKPKPKSSSYITIDRPRRQGQLLNNSIDSMQDTICELISEKYNCDDIVSRLKHKELMTVTNILKSVCKLKGLQQKYGKAQISKKALTAFRKCDNDISSLLADKRNYIPKNEIRLKLLAIGRVDQFKSLKLILRENAHIRDILTAKR